MHNKFFSRYYFIDKFDKNHLEKLDRSIHIIYRQTKNNENFKIIKNILKYCRKNNIKFYLANNFKLAIKLGLDGAYIPSYNSELSHLSYKYKKDFILIGSAHNLKELRNKELQKINKIVLSSVFKKNKNYLGFNKFNLKSKLTSKEVIALGGVSKRNFKRLKLINCFSFAGISYFE